MNKYELFSALQASLMFLIMRAIDTGPQQSTEDFELVRAHEVRNQALIIAFELFLLIIIKVICDYTLQQIGHHANPEANDPNRQWKDWIFDESIKRYLSYLAFSFETR